ncbi:MAG: hypothetical protein K2X93_22080 [Candidatus Obscuribacterales bacterium]|nr:hypothetical protein [Candidatus Obscuribacterales bacterium]
MSFSIKPAEEFSSDNQVFTPDWQQQIKSEVSDNQLVDQMRMAGSNTTERFLTPLQISCEVQSEDSNNEDIDAEKIQERTKSAIEANQKSLGSLTAGAEKAKVGLGACNRQLLQDLERVWNTESDIEKNAGNKDKDGLRLRLDLLQQDVDRVEKEVDQERTTIEKPIIARVQIAGLRIASGDDKAIAQGELELLEIVRQNASVQVDPDFTEAVIKAYMQMTSVRKELKLTPWKCSLSRDQLTREFPPILGANQNNAQAIMSRANEVFWKDGFEKSQPLFFEALDQARKAQPVIELRRLQLFVDGLNLTQTIADAVVNRRDVEPLKEKRKNLFEDELEAHDNTRALMSIEVNVALAKIASGRAELAKEGKSTIAQWLDRDPSLLSNKEFRDSLRGAFVAHRASRDKSATAAVKPASNAQPEAKFKERFDVAVIYGASQHDPEIKKYSKDIAADVGVAALLLGSTGLILRRQYNRYVANRAIRAEFGPAPVEGAPSKVVLKSSDGAGKERSYEVKGKMPGTDLMVIRDPSARQDWKGKEGLPVPEGFDPKTGKHGDFKRLYVGGTDFFVSKDNKVFVHQKDKLILTREILLSNPTEFKTLIASTSASDARTSEPLKTAEDVKPGLKFTDRKEKLEVVAVDKAKEIVILKKEQVDKRPEIIFPSREEMKSFRVVQLDGKTYYCDKRNEVWERTGSSSGMKSRPDLECESLKEVVHRLNPGQPLLAGELSAVTLPPAGRTEFSNQSGTEGKAKFSTDGVYERVVEVDGKMYRLKCGTTAKGGSDPWFYATDLPGGKSASADVKITVLVRNPEDLVKLQAELIPEIYRACETGKPLNGLITAVKTMDPMHHFIPNLGEQVPWQNRSLATGRGQGAKGFTIYCKDAASAALAQAHFDSFLLSKGLAFPSDFRPGTLADGFVNNEGSRRVALTRDQFELGTRFGDFGALLPTELSDAARQLAEKRVNERAPGWESYKSPRDLYGADGRLKYDALQKLGNEFGLDNATARLVYSDNISGEPRNQLMLLNEDTALQHRTKGARLYLGEDGARHTYVRQSDGSIKPNEGLTHRPAMVEVAKVCSKELGQDLDLARLATKRDLEAKQIPRAPRAQQPEEPRKSTSRDVHSPESMSTSEKSGGTSVDSLPPRDSNRSSEKQSNSDNRALEERFVRRLKENLKIATSGKNSGPLSDVETRAHMHKAVVDMLVRDGITAKDAEVVSDFVKDYLSKKEAVSRRFNEIARAEGLVIEGWTEESSKAPKPDVAIVNPFPPSNAVLTEGTVVRVTDRGIEVEPKGSASKTLIQRDQFLEHLESEKAAVERIVKDRGAPATPEEKKLLDRLGKNIESVKAGEVNPRLARAVAADILAKRSRGSGAAQRPSAGNVGFAVLGLGTGLLGLLNEARE